jgi:hypothetical protein
LTEIRLIDQIYADILRRWKEFNSCFESPESPPDGMILDENQDLTPTTSATDASNVGENGGVPETISINSVPPTEAATSTNTGCNKSPLPPIRPFQPESLIPGLQLEGNSCDTHDPTDSKMSYHNAPSHINGARGSGQHPLNVVDDVISSNEPQDAGVLRMTKGFTAMVIPSLNDSMGTQHLPPSLTNPTTASMQQTLGSGDDKMELDTLPNS